ncbi:MAG: Ig-like domain-containing protein [Acidobacteriia bacterium]|nr:Ig-like domain-containing protein [Terriglobia bacterium]
MSAISVEVRVRSRAWLWVVLGLFASVAFAQTNLRKIGELELGVQGISATVQPANPTIPKNTAAGVRIVVNTPSGALSSADVVKFLGGNFEVHGELSGPGLAGTVTLPFVDPNGGAAPIVDPLLLPIPPLSEAGDYTLSNLRIVVNGSPALDVSPATIPVKVIDQVLITSVETRPLTLDEIKAAGIVLDSSDFLGFQFTIGLALQSNATTISFPVVFDRKGVPIPQPLLPPGPQSRDQVPIPTIVPVLLNLLDVNGNPVAENDIKLPNGKPAPVKIPSVLVIPGDIGFLKQFFSAQLFVANGAPGGSGLVVHDVNGTINLPSGDDAVAGTADDPLSLPNTKDGPEPATKTVRGVGADAKPGTADDVNILNPGDQGQAEFILRGEKEGFHQISFNIQGILEGLATGPVGVSGLAQGGVLVRNPFFDLTFAVPAIVRNGEQFKVYVTVKNLSQSIANAVNLTIDSSRLSGATLLSDPTQFINTIAGGGATTLTYVFKSRRTGQVVASYLHFDTTDGSTGELKFTLGVGERGIPLSPDTLVLPSSVENLPQSVIDAAMLVLGEGWSIANAPNGTLPPNVIRTNKSVVTQKALALAEAGLRAGLGQPMQDALRDLLADFYGGKPLDAGFDQLLRSTQGGQNFERAVGAALAGAVSSTGGALNFQNDLTSVFASGPDFISFALASGTGAPPVGFTLTDGNGNVARQLGSVTPLPNDIPGFGQVPLSNMDAAPVLGLLTTPAVFPYTLQLTGTGSGTVDLAISMPHGDGNVIRGQISGVPMTLGMRARVKLDSAQPDRLILELDTNNDGSFATQQPLSTTTVAPQGPRFVSATIIGPETLPGASSLGVQLALLFDRVVDATSAQLTTNYQMPANAIQKARSQLSGRIVVANLQQPEGPYVPSSVTVSGIADARGATGIGGTVPLQTKIEDPGAVVLGRVFNADGTPVSTAVVTYSTVPPADCAAEADELPVGVSSVPVSADGRYEFRYVRQDSCGMPFQISTQDPNTGGLRQLSNFVRIPGQQLLMDIPILGKGSVAGTVHDLSGNPVPAAAVVVLSQTDTQIGAQTTADGNGHYSVSGVTVGPVSVQAGKGNSIGRSAGSITRAGNTATIDVTLDSGQLSVSGSLQKQENGVTTPVPNWPVVYSISDPIQGTIPVGVVNTDAAGNFSFSSVPTGNFTISSQLTANDRGSITGFATANQNLTGQNITIVINTANQGTVTGKISMPDGSPAGGVVVLSGVTGVLSNADGTYTLPGLPVRSGSQTISAATRDGLRSGSTTVSITVPGQTFANANIVLSGLGTAKFTVLDSSGRPVANQNVALLSGACPFACGCDPKATGPDGVVTFSGLPVGQVSAVAISSSFDVSRASASIVADGTTGFGVLRFAGTGSVTGNVLAPDGAPVFGADIALTSNVFDQDSCSLVQGLSQRISTDLSGNFHFSNVRVGQIGVTASQIFFPTQVGAQGAISSAGQTVNFNLKLVNTISGVLSGTVFLPDGITPAGAGVEVTANGPLPDVTVTTDANSHFKFAKIFPEGTYKVTARDPISGGVVQDTLFLRAAQDMAHDLRLKGRGTVTVQVVDGSNQPVDTAFVKLTETNFPNSVQEDAVQPANQGRVTFEQVFEGPFTIEVSDIVGRGGRTASILPNAGATVNVVVQLTTTGTVRGHFLMPDSSPIPFGTVRLLANGRQIGQLTTDGNADPGAFSFTFVPAGPVRLEAQDPVTARTGVAAGSITTDGQILVLDVVAQGLGTVTGLVTLNGAPEPGASVDVFSGSYHATTLADATGRYLISGVPEGHITANASLQNGFLAGTASSTLVGDGSQLNLDVALRGSGSLSGQVLQADGVTPAPASLVTVQVGGQGGGTQSVTTDPNGNFSFAIVPAGTASIAVTVLGSIDQAKSSIEILSGSTVQAAIRLNGIGSISGHTLDSLGNPVKGHISVSGTGAFPYSFVIDSSTDGSFSLPQVLAGTFTASLSVQSAITLFGSTSSSVLPNQNTDITIQVQPSGTVIGTVFRSDGVTPAAGANVTLILDRGGSVVVQSQTDGTFTAQGIPIGGFTVRVNDPVSTGQALVQGASIAANGQTFDLGRIVLNDSPLAVVSFDPADGATGEPTNQPIKISFSNPLQSLSGISFTANGSNLFLSGSLSTDGKLATFTGTLPDSSQIVVTVSSSVSDIFGRHPAQTTTATFQTVDLKPPFVASIVPANGAIQVPATSTIAVNFSEPLAATTNLTGLVVVTGPSGVVSGSTVLATSTLAVFTPASPLPTNASFTVTVNGAKDLSGNVQTTPFVSTFATVDTIAPVLQVTFPANGAFITSARPTISISTTDVVSGVNTASVTITLDGQQVATGTLTFTPATNLTDGPHTLSVSVADRAGNVSSASTTFNVDTLPPSVPVISGVTENQVLSGLVSISATATDANGVNHIDVLLDNSVLFSLTGPAFQHTVNTALLSEGSHRISARAIDNAGNTGPASAPIDVVINNQQLTVSITSPAPTSRFRNSVTVAASASEPVQKIDFTLGTQTFSVAALPFQAIFDLSAVPEGNQTISVTATGFAGETAVSSVTIVVDRTPPAVNATLIAAFPPSNGISNVVGQSGATEAGALVRITNTVTSAQVTTTAATNGSFSVNISGAVGDLLSLTATDAVGNTSAAITFSIRSVPPLPPVVQVQPADGSVTVPTNVHVVVRFASTVSSSAVVSGTLKLLQGTTNVPGSVVLSADGLSLTFTPNATLAGLTLYTVAVQDVAGGQTSPQFQSSFTTDVAKDLTAPTVLHINPENGATGVPINSAVTALFSKQMDPGSLTSTTFQLQDTLTSVFVAGIVQVNPDGRSASVVPTSPLPAGHRLNVFLRSGITDSAGNLLSAVTFSFTTSFVNDTAPPALVAVNPPDQSSGVATNTPITLQFSEPISSVSAQNGIQLLVGGQPVTGSVSLSSGNSIATLVPTAALLPNTAYTVSVAASISDFAGNQISNARSTTFVTGAASDAVRPSVALVDPVNNAVGVGTNTVVRLQFSERINAISVNSGTLQMTRNQDGVFLAASAITASADGLSATWSGPLAPSTQYQVRWVTNGITDLAGQGINGGSSLFSTAQGTDTVAPLLAATSPANGASAVAVNTRVIVQFNEAMETVGIGQPFTVTGGGTTVSGSVSANANRTALIFTPSSLLAPSTVYSVTVNGLQDLAGNAAATVAFSFTTGTSAVADTTRPSFVSINPPFASTNVATVNGAVITFTPAGPLPGNTVINTFVNSTVLDLAGNPANAFSGGFTTGAGTTDTAVPQVVSVSPQNGAIGIGPNAQVVLTFSEPLNANTVNNNTFALLSNGVNLGAGVSRSGDNQTVVLSTGTLPAGSVVTVVATRDVQDLAGNHLVDFQSTFSTAAAVDTVHPFIASQRPGVGATNVGVNSTIVLYANESLNAGTVAGALHVVQNGAVVAGTVQVGNNGQTIEFVPAGPFAGSALIEITLDSTAQDLDGVALNTYQASFRTAADAATVATGIVNSAPVNGTTGVPLNAVISVQMSRAVNITTVNGSSFAVRDNTTNVFIGGQTYAQSADGTTVTFVPPGALTANRNYTVFFSQFQAVRDVAGNAIGLLQFSFTTGTDTATVGPQVVLVSPPNGASNIGVNANVRVRFNVPINPITVNAATIQIANGTQVAVPETVFFSNNEQDVVLVLHEPLPANTQMTVTVSGVSDLAGNPVVPSVTHFTTTVAPDVAVPVAIALSPGSGFTNVGTNTAISVQLNEPVDFGAVNGSSFAVRDNATNVFIGGQSYTLSPDGTLVNFVAPGPLATGHSYTVFFSQFQGVTDYAGNAAGISQFSFTTSFTPDTTIPQVVGVSPADTTGQAPLNTQVVIAFNEPVQGSSIGQVTLSSGGGQVVVQRTLSNGNRTLTLTPVNPLSVNTVYTVRVAGVQDLGSNTLVAPVTTSFSTGTEADLIRPSVVVVDPVNNAVGVGTNTVVRLQFSERINAITATNSTLQILQNSTGTQIPVSVSVSADGLTASLTAALSPSTQYQVRWVTNGITDLAGQGINGGSSLFTTAQGTDTVAPLLAATSPANGANAVAVNARVIVQFNEAMEAVGIGQPFTVTGGGTTVSGSVSANANRTALIFTPSSLLAPSTVYSVTVNGLQDLAGNAAATVAFSFTTGTSAVADTGEWSGDHVHAGRAVAGEHGD